MSRKSRRNRPAPQPAAPAAEPSPGTSGRRTAFLVAAIVLLVAFAGGAFVFMSARFSEQAAERNHAVAAAAHAPTTGPQNAKVHIVEFLDPACGTCRAFYPHVKKILAADRDRIRLTVRHVAFHEGAAEVVKMLEASRSQGKYWQALEALLAAQPQWTISHRVHADLAWRVLATVDGLSLERVRLEMNAPEIARRIEKDAQDARALGVSKTPEFFVNGRPMPSFGLEELQDLVKDALAR